MPSARTQHKIVRLGHPSVGALSLALVAAVATPNRTMLNAVMLLACFISHGAAFAVRVGGHSRPTFPMTAASSASRASAPLALEPYRQDDMYDYYRMPVEKEFVLSKPLGAGLIDGAKGATVEVVQEGANADKVLRKGDTIIAVMGTDVSGKSVEEVMTLLTAAPERVKLDVSRTTITRQPRNTAAPAVAPATAAGIAVPSAPAVPEKNKLDKAFEKNFGSAEAMQKLGNKVVKTTLNPTTWKNGIYFWSVAGTAVLFLPILFYVLTKG